MRKYYQTYYLALKQVLQDEVLLKVRELVQKHYHIYPEYERLLNPLEEWQNRDFQVLASLLGIQSSCCKRLYECPGFKGQKKFSKKNSQALAFFLGYEEWEDLEKFLYLKFRALSG